MKINKIINEINDILENLEKLNLDIFEIYKINENETIIIARTYILNCKIYITLNYRPLLWYPTDENEICIGTWIYDRKSIDEIYNIYRIVYEKLNDILNKELTKRV